MVRAQRHPVDEIVNLYIAPFDMGFLLSYLGAEPTYATAIATLRRIFKKEIARLREQSMAASTMVQEPVLKGGDDARE